MFDSIKKNIELFKRLPDLVQDATLSLLKSYQDKTVKLAKLRAAQLYVKGVKAARVKVLALFLALFGLTVAACGLIVVPLTLILMSGLERQSKFILVGLWGVVTVLVPMALVARFFSEKAWLEFSKSDELMKDLVENGQD